jgi:hypothetical protein
MDTLPIKTAAPGHRGIPAWVFVLAGMVLLMLCANGLMVWLSSHGRRDLVRADYYDAGLQEDNSIARNALARAAGRVDLRRIPEGWEIETGVDLAGSDTCRAHFYRPDDGREDRVLVLTRSGGGSGGRGLWRGSKLDLRRGQWIVNLVWEENGSPRSETSIRYLAH